MQPTTRTLFDDIIEQKILSWAVWEDDEFMAFLTPFPNMAGVTVVIPKQNPGDYVFTVDTELYTRFMLAVRTVALKLNNAFDTPRVALVVEGTGAPHIHAKLYPLQGPQVGQSSIRSDEQEFVDQYRGWFTTLDGPRMSDAQLREYQQQIRSAQ